MKRFLLIAALLIGSVSLASAQGIQGCYTTNGNNCIKVGTPETGNGAWGPLPVTGSVTISPSTLTITTSNLNITGTVSVNNFTSAALRTSNTLTTQAAGYTAGNCLGGFNSATVTNLNGQSGFLTNFTINNLSGATPTLTVFIFDSNPSTSTCTDNGTFSLSSSDVDKLIASPIAITLAAPTNVTSPSTASINFTPPQPFIAGGSTSSGVKTIYYGLVTSAITPSTTSGYHTNIGTALN